MVRTYDFQLQIENICLKRNDEWSTAVLGRLNSAVADLPAADTAYHQVCSINFRTNKNIPKRHLPQTADATGNSCKRLCTGRPTAFVRSEALDNAVKFFENNNGQVNIQEISDKMKDFLPETEEPYSVKRIKQILLEDYSDCAVLISSSGKPDVVTFHKTVTSILKEHYDRPREASIEQQRKQIIETVGSIINSELKSINTPKDVYTGLDNISASNSLEFLPNSLKILLASIISHDNSDLKIAGIGQAIVQAAKPRSVITPIQLSLGIHLYNHFSSSFVIKTLNKFGYCSSYSEVTKFMKCAALHEHMPVSDSSESSFIHYVADNVDHNICTIDGRGSFHGMGIISATIPPRVKHPLIIARKEVLSYELKRMGSIPFHIYKQANVGSLVYTELVPSLVNDILSCIDILWYSTWFFHDPHPTWSVYMQTVVRGEHNGKAALFFHPMIDHNPSDTSCVFSTLLYVSSEAEKHHVTPVITFDQPLFWKAITIINAEPLHSKLKNVVVLLGGFHTRMNFLGCIGYIMQNTGLTDVLEQVYASNTVKHIFSGKAVSRAIRAHILVDLALNIILLEKVYEIQSDSNMQSPQSQDFRHEASVIFQGVLSGDLLISELESSEAVSSMKQNLEKIKLKLESSELASLWFQYMEMVCILKNFIRAERIGDWLLHLQSMKDMLPYMAASGHNLYTKSLRIHIQNMTDLEEHNESLYAKFKQGMFVIRRSDRFWGGLSPDLIIEQTLMRSLKSTGGLTRGRGMDDVQRNIWTLSMPVAVQINETMRELTGLTYTTSEQHCEKLNTRVKRDNNDTDVIVKYLKPLNIFNEGRSICNIANGLVAHESVNVHNANTIGKVILNNMTGQDSKKYSVPRKCKAVTMATKSAVRIGEDDVTIDQGLLFQRLSTAASKDSVQLKDAMTFELSTYPQAIFENVEFLRPAVKSSLANALWKNISTPSDNVQLSPSCHYVIDGGWLLHQIPWHMRSTYESICSAYTSFVIKHYGKATVVFDAYCNGPTTKDLMHLRRNKGYSCQAIEFTGEMLIVKNKHEFLSNELNKQRIINAIAQRLADNGCNVIHANSDADLLIVTTAIGISNECETCVVGNDTDLIVLLIYHAKCDSHQLFMQTEKRLWHINHVKNELVTFCDSILFIHAFLGCDTTSSFYGIGKQVALKMAKTDQRFQNAASKFIQESATKENIFSAGEQALLSIYKGRRNDTLKTLRYSLFMKKLGSSKTFVEPRRLPPTDGSAKFHFYRVYLQVMEWKGTSSHMSAEDWGWYLDNGRYYPVMTDKKPAPESLLHVICCKCKTGCDNMRCTCRRHQLECTSACSECVGVNCTNCVLLEDMSSEEDGSDLL